MITPVVWLKSTRLRLLEIQARKAVEFAEMLFNETTLDIEEYGYGHPWHRATLAAAYRADIRRMRWERWRDLAAARIAA